MTKKNRCLGTLGRAGATCDVHNATCRSAERSHKFLLANFTNMRWTNWIDCPLFGISEEFKFTKTWFCIITYQGFNFPYHICINHIHVCDLWMHHKRSPNTSWTATWPQQIKPKHILSLERTWIHREAVPCGFPELIVVVFLFIFIYTIIIVLEISRSKKQMLFLGDGFRACRCQLQGDPFAQTTRSSGDHGNMAMPQRCVTDGKPLRDYLRASKLQRIRPYQTITVAHISWGFMWLYGYFQ